jgi:tubulin polyglutamylase TTLL6/13
MLEICRKKALARNIAKMASLFAEEYKFVPKSYQLPNALNEFLAEFKPKKKRTWILKPDSGCQGKGIVLVQVKPP